MTKTYHGSTRKYKRTDPRKNAIFKNYCNNGSNIDLKCPLKYLHACLNATIEVTKVLKKNIIIRQ